MRLMLYERLTFLLVTGVLGLFFLAFVLGALGVILTLYPDLVPLIRRRSQVLLEQARIMYGQERERLQAFRLVILSGVSGRFR